MKKLIVLSLTSLFIFAPFTKVNSSPVENTSFLEFDLGPTDIYSYLSGLGYTLYGTPVQSGNNWTVHTSLGTAQYNTTVFTDGTNIVGHEDIGF